MNGYRKWLTAASLGLMILLCGCGTAKENVQESKNFNVNAAEGEEDKVNIGLSVDSFILERWVRDREVFVAEARELGAEVNVQDAGGDAREQASQIEYLIKKGMDVIAVVARDCNSLSEVIKEAKDAGIPVISYDRLNYNSDSDFYISFDSRQVGVLMAEALIEAIPDGGDIFMIQGSADDDNIYLIKEGFDETIQGSKLNVVYTATCAGWIAEEAVAHVEEALKKYPDVKGIMCGNDEIAGRVIQVLAENRKAGKVAVVGQDGDIAACQRIVEGTQYMTAFKPVEDEAREAAAYAVRLAKGEELTEIHKLVDDGSYKIPSKILMPVAVTGKNMDKIVVEGGYHRKEDVYLNVKY